MAEFVEGKSRNLLSHLLDCHLLCHVIFVLSALQVQAFSVCDDPDYFYDFVQGLLDGLEAGVDSRQIINIENVSVSADQIGSSLFNL